MTAIFTFGLSIYLQRKEEKKKLREKAEAKAAEAAIRERAEIKARYLRAQHAKFVAKDDALFSDDPCE